MTWSAVHIEFMYNPKIEEQWPYIVDPVTEKCVSYGIFELA